MTFIRSFSNYVNCGRAIYRVGMTIFVYFRLKPSLSLLAVMFIASTILGDFLVALATQAATGYAWNWTCSAAGAWGAFVSGGF